MIDGNHIKSKSILNKHIKSKNSLYIYIYKTLFLVHFLPLKERKCIYKNLQIVNTIQALEGLFRKLSISFFSFSFLNPQLINDRKS